MAHLFYRNYSASDTTVVETPGDVKGSTSTFKPIYGYPSTTSAYSGTNWPAPEGYEFKEWNLNRDGSGAAFHPGETITQTVDTSFYAIWQTESPTISKIMLPSGSTYFFKDLQARSDISAIESAIAGGVTFMGETTTALTDGATTSSVTINGNSVTAVKGYLVVYQSTEFIYDGTKWIELGDLSLIGDLGWQDSATTEYTPAGSVSKPSFTPSSVDVSFTITDNTSGNYQPKGTVSKPNFTGSTSSFNGTITPSGSVALKTTNRTATVSAGSGSVTYTPEGTITVPTISIKTPGATTTFNSITSTGTLPELTASVSDETLALTWNAGTLPTKGENVTVRTGDAALQSSIPTFSGTGVRLVTDNIAVPTSASFTGDEDTVNVSGKPNGGVSQPTFTGTKTQINGSAIASGDVSQPTFTGTKATITVH